MNVPLRMLVATVLLILTVVTGVGTSQHGKPYPGPLYSAHRLLSLLLTGYTLLFILGLLGMERPGGALVLLLVLGGLSVAGLFVSGALLDVGRISADRARMVHSIASALMIVTIGAFLILMMWRITLTIKEFGSTTPKSPVSSGQVCVTVET